MEHINEKEKRKNVRRVLWQWGDTMRRCERKLEEINSLLRLIEDTREISPRPYDGMPHTSAVSNPTEQTAMRIDEITASFEAAIKIVQNDIEDAMTMKACIDELIDMLSPDQQRVIEMRYIEGKSWMIIGFKMNMEESGTRYIERSAVNWIADFVAIEKPSRFFPFFSATM